MGALQHLSEEGHLYWTCYRCKGPLIAHVNHSSVKFSPILEGAPKHHRLVELPKCECGNGAILKVDFTEEELAAPNMWLSWTDTLEERLEQLEQNQDMTYWPEIAFLQEMKARGGQPTPSYAVALRHIALGRMMEEAGKEQPIIAVNPNEILQAFIISPLEFMTPSEKFDWALAVFKEAGVPLQIVAPWDSSEENDDRTLSNDRRWTNWMDMPNVRAR